MATTQEIRKLGRRERTLLLRLRKNWHPCGEPLELDEQGPCRSLVAKGLAVRERDPRNRRRWLVWRSVLGDRLVALYGDDIRRGKHMSWSHVLSVVRSSLRRHAPPV